MKCLCFLSLLCLLVAGGRVVHAEDGTVHLAVATDLIAKTCPTPVWKGTTLLWRGVTDKRPEPEVGIQSKKKGRDVVHVVADPSLDKVLGDVLPNLLSTCGVHLVREGKIDREISVEVQEFYAGVEKGFFTGKETARSKITFVIKDRGEIFRTVDVGYEMEAKKIRKKDLKQLESTLNELLFRTLGEVPRLDGFKDL